MTLWDGISGARMSVRQNISSVVLACILMAGLFPATALAADYDNWNDIALAADNELTLTQGDTVAGSGDASNPKEYVLTGKTITLNGTLTVSGHVRLIGGKILRGQSHRDSLFIVSGSGNSLALEGVTVDGNKPAVEASASLVEIDQGGAVILGGGSELTNNKLLSSTSGKGSAVTVTESALHIAGGSITNNESVTNGGSTVKTYYGATVTMTSGKIRNNSGSRHGGAIQLYGAKMYEDFSTKQTTFTMSGGEITGNSLGYSGGVGGGVAISKTAAFIMSGGEISGNACGASGRGGGVSFTDGNDTSMQISGPAVVIGNQKGSTENNLEIGTNSNNLLKATGAVTGAVGITRTYNSTTVFTSSDPAVTPADSIVCFSSDNRAYKVVSDSGQLRLEAVPNTISITAQPQNAQVDEGGVSGSLTVAATVSNGGYPTYQWYSCTNASRANPRAISGARGTSMTIPVALAAGTYYYFCRVSAADAADANSNAAAVTVRPAQTTAYTVSVSANPPAGGAVTGGGTYLKNASVTVTASPNSGYRFVRWTENGSEVSRSASYTFPASASRVLVAAFESDAGDVPVIISPAKHQEIFAYVGGHATLSVTARDATSYQWYVDRGSGFALIDGATGSSYTTPAAALENDGYRYCCVAVNAYGSSDQSPVFTLRVLEANIPDTGDDSRLGLWTALATLSLAALSACWVFWRRKRTDRY